MTVFPSPENGSIEFGTAAIADELVSHAGSMALSKRDLSETAQQQAENKIKVSALGEIVNERVSLVNDPERGSTWQQWLVHDDVAYAIWRDLKIVEAPDANEWLHLVEHNMFVAAVALTISERVLGPLLDDTDETGAPTIFSRQDVIRAGFIHDAGTRHNVEKRISRQAEASGEDTLVTDVFLAHGVSPDVIAAAKNTGRLYDRFLGNEDERRAAIANRSLLADVIAYADARTNNATVVTLEEARAHYAAVKPDEKSQAFFAQNGPWINYYKSIESMFDWIRDGVGEAYDPLAISVDAIYETVQRAV